MEYESECGAWFNVTLVISKPEFPECPGAVELFCWAWIDQI